MFIIRGLGKREEEVLKRREPQEAETSRGFIEGFFES